MSSTSILRSQTPTLRLPGPFPITITPLLLLQTLLVVYSEIWHGSGRSTNLPLSPLVPIPTPVPTIQAQAPSPLLRPSSRSVLRASARAAPAKKTSEATSFGQSISRQL